MYDALPLIILLFLTPGADDPRGRAAAELRHRHRRGLCRRAPVVFARGLQLG
jgi:hypothetical protein